MERLHFGHIFTYEYLKIVEPRHIFVNVERKGEKYWKVEFDLESLKLYYFKDVHGPVMEESQFATLGEDLQQSSEGSVTSRRHEEGD